MKSFAAALVVLSAIAVSNAARADVVVIPGAPLQLTPVGLKLIEAALARPAELEQLFDRGGEVLAVTAYPHIEGIEFSIVVGTCTVDPGYICLPHQALYLSRSYVAGRFIDSARLESAEGVRLEQLKHRLNDTTGAVVNALAHVFDDVREHFSNQNVVSASSQFVSPYLSRFTLTVRHRVGGTIANITETTDHTMLHRKRYETKLTFLR